MQDEFTIAEAAGFLGISNQGVRDAIRRGAVAAAGQPRKISRSDVLAFYRERRAEAAQRHPDLKAYAEEINGLLWPEDESGSWKASNADGSADAEFMARNIDRIFAAHKLRANPGDYRLSDAVTLFSRPVVETVCRRAALKKARACLWCYQDGLAAVHDLPSAPDTAAHKVLLGQPCVRDRDRWVKQRASARRASAQSASAAGQRSSAGRQSPPSPRTAAQRELLEASTAVSHAEALLNSARISGNYGSRRKANDMLSKARRRFENAQTAFQGRGWS